MKKLLAILVGFMLLFGGIAAVTAPTASAGTYVSTCTSNTDKQLIEAIDINFSGVKWGTSSIWYDTVTKNICATTITTVSSLVGVNHYVGIWIYHCGESNPNLNNTLYIWNTGVTTLYKAVWETTPTTGHGHYIQGRIDDLAGHTAYSDTGRCWVVN